MNIFASILEQYGGFTTPPTLAQLVGRRTVVLIVILRSLVTISTILSLHKFLSQWQCVLYIAKFIGKGVVHVDVVVTFTFIM